MKRFLSWVVLLVLTWVFDWVNSKFWILVFWAGGEISGINRALFIVILLFAVGTILSIVFYGSLTCAAMCVKASQAIRHSKKGVRYIVVAVVYGLVDLLIVVGVFAGFATPKWQSLAYAVTGVIFLCALVGAGRSFSAEDGGPKSKVEELEEKLARAKAKEAAKNNE